MGLGTAVLILGLLWFYFKEPRLRKAVHWGGLVFGILAVFGGAIWGVIQLKENHDEKVRAREQQEQEQREAQQQAKICADWEAKHPIGSPLETSKSETYSDAPANVVFDAPVGCQGPLEDAYRHEMQAKWEVVKEAHAPKKKHEQQKSHPKTYGTVTVVQDTSLFKRCRFYVDERRCIIEDTIAVLSASEVLTVLQPEVKAEDGAHIYEVRTTQGWKGWVEAGRVHLNPPPPDFHAEKLKYCGAPHNNDRFCQSSYDNYDDYLQHAVK